MKIAGQLVVIAILVVLQVALAHVLPVASVNFVLVYVVVASTVVDYIPLLWTALFGGLLLDLAGAGGSFGYNIGFLLLVVIVTKLIIRLQEYGPRFWQCLLVIWGLTLLYSLGSIGLIITSLGQLPLRQLLLRLLASLLYNSLATAVAVASFRTLKNRGRRLNRHAHTRMA